MDPLRIGLYKNVAGSGAFFEEPFDATCARVRAWAEQQAAMKLEEPVDGTQATRIGTLLLVPTSNAQKYVVRNGVTKRAPTASSGTAVIQSLVFDKDVFTLDQARKWVASHEGFVDEKVDETGTSYRFRQYEPEHFSTFRSRPLAEGLMAVFGIVKTDDEQAASGEAVAAAVDTGEAMRTTTKAVVRRLRTADAWVRKADPKTEERFVLNLVLEPNDGTDEAPLAPDTQQDVYSAADIRATAHRWMEEYGQIDLNHSWEPLQKGQVAVLESYINPVTYKMETPDGPRTLYKGTWMLALRIRDDRLWEAVKAGEIGAYSIGGIASRQPLAETP